MAHTLFVPLMLTLGAGLATGIGSTIALFAHRTKSDCFRSRWDCRAA